MSRGLQPLARTIFEGLSPSYDRVLDAATLLQDRYWKRWLLSEASIGGGERILDVGCGTGVLEEGLQAGRGEVVGLDLTEEMIRLAQRKRVPSIDSLCLGDAERLPFADGSFDLLLSCYVVKYCSAPLLASEATPRPPTRWQARALRLLKAAGRLRPLPRVLHLRGAEDTRRGPPACRRPRRVHLRSAPLGDTDAALGR